MNLVSKRLNVRRHPQRLSKSRDRIRRLILGRKHANRHSHSLRVLRIDHTRMRRGNGGEDGIVSRGQRDDLRALPNSSTGALALISPLEDSEKYMRSLSPSLPSTDPQLPISGLSRRSSW